MSHQRIAAWNVYHDISLAAITAVALGIGHSFTWPVARVLHVLEVNKSWNQNRETIIVM
jgi:hypothetical protein